MSQTPILIVATDHTDQSITIAFPDSKRVEYLLGSMYWPLLNRVNHAYDSGWYNFVVAQLTKHAWAIYINGKRADKAQEELNTMVDFRKSPSEEFSWTVIATEAQGITYNGGRKWFKTSDDAKTFAAEVFELERNKKAAFDLAIVQCQDVVRPKPQIELISSFKRKEESEG